MTLPKVVYINESKFRDGMLNLRRRGGAHQQAYDNACKLVVSLGYGMDEINKLTNHGETRIKHCRKYDISRDAHRLVTLHTEGYIYLLHVGAHDEVDAWLDQNRGLTITVHAETKKIQVTHITKANHEPRSSAGQNFGASTEENIPYLKRLNGFDVREIVTQSFIVKQLELIDENSSDDDIQEITAHVSQDDSEAGLLLLDVFLELRAGDKSRAFARIEEFRGKATDIALDPALESLAIADDTNSENIRVLSELDDEEVKKLFTPDKFQEWMLFPHAEQKRIAQKESERPVVLTGVSGSGKTCVLVHRACFLAKKYPGETILVLTLNRSLSRLLQNLTEAICPEGFQKQIRVMAFYDYFEQLVRHFGPKKYLAQLTELARRHSQSVEIRETIGRVNPDTYAREYDPIGNETLDDTWNLFLEQPYTQTLLTYLTERVRSYDYYMDVAEYLREEFSLLRSAVVTSDRRAEYFKLARSGRAIRFDEQTRTLVLDLLLLFEETMLAGGLLDELSLTLTLIPHFSELKSIPQDLRFRCLLVDEFQDLSTRDLGLLRQLAPREPNSIFLTGDTVQRILVKDLRLSAVGLDVTSASWESIKKNYRNSKQILQAASKLANAYGEEAKRQGVEIEVLDPELAERETARPLAICVAEKDQIAAAYQLARECLDLGSALPWSICIATATPDEFPVSRLLRERPYDFPFQVEPLTGDYTQSRDRMTVATVSEVKGFEFSMVIVVGCSDKQLPPRSGCSAEAWRHALRLYVAMTRGRDQVALIYSGEPSKFLKVMDDQLTWQSRAAEGEPVL